PHTSLPSFSFFFFYSPAPHPNLHSFPTRRSSDLNPTLSAPGGAVLIDTGAPALGGLETYIGIGTNRDSSVILTNIAGSSVQINPDRKSTRLNSSHVAISYAVFCLKKKKNKKIKIQ